MNKLLRQPVLWAIAASLCITTALYWPGLKGDFLFDDYPNIIDNSSVQPHTASLGNLVNAALSSPSSEFKRPLASLSFAINYLFTGLNPYWMKLTNLVIHLLNGLLVFLLARSFLSLAKPSGDRQGAGIAAALIALSWMILPINLTAVLYVVQRMESMANVFVLLGLLGYVSIRTRMIGMPQAYISQCEPPKKWLEVGMCALSIIAPTVLGLLAKETAVMLPLYAFLTEWILFRFKGSHGTRDIRLIILFVATLWLPLLVGSVWLAPQILNPSLWATRDFTLETRLLSEARVVVDYVLWILIPTPGNLSFYHDNFQISAGLFAPWTTFACILVLVGLIALAVLLRNRHPLATLGIALFLSCQLLTATVLPLELIYEHRNYFASFGVLLALFPLIQEYFRPLPLARHTLLAGFILLWAGQTAMTAMAWGDPITLAETLADRAPDSPRAQYELGRTYIIYSHYDPASPFTKLAYAPLEKAASLVNSSILPEQALIFMNSRMHLPLKDSWWDMAIAKLKSRKPGVQDESSLGALTRCMRDHQCDLPANRMTSLYLAALSHPAPSARLLAMYGDYAWNVLQDRSLGERMTQEASMASPDEPAYRITLVRMLIAQGRIREANKTLLQLEQLNYGGRLESSLEELRTSLDHAKTAQ
jgi:hypothetical protein